MDNEKQIPALRFRGFDGPWEKKKLGELGSLKNGMNFVKDAMDHGSPFVNIQDIFGKNIVDVDHLGKAEATPKQQKDYDLKKGDVLFVRSSVKLEGVGECALIPRDLPQTTYSGFMIRFRDEVGMNDNFKRYVFAAKNVRAQILAQATNSANKNISQPILASLKFSVPSVTEQKAVGDFCSDMEDSIATLEQKITKAEQFRRAMLSKLFPAEGASEPALRFRGFSGPWNRKPFGEVATVRRGLTYSPENVRKKGIRVLRSSNIQENAFIVANDDVFVNADAVNIPMVKNGDILITAANGSTQLVGKHAIIHGLPERSAVPGGFMLLASSDNTDFLNASMGSAWYGKFISQYVAGGNGALGNLNKADLEKQVIPVPSKEEQKCIGDFFHQLDSYISLQKEKLEKLRRLKAALLEKLFV